MPSVFSDRYRMVRKLGAGSFGKVYVVAELATGRQHVLKEVALAGLLMLMLDFILGSSSSRGSRTQTGKIYYRVTRFNFLFPGSG